MQLRLNQAKERLKDIDLKLEDPDVVKDLDAFRKLSKEKANLDPIIEKYDEYLKLVSDREDALLMLKDSDEEIIKFAKETIDNIDKELIDIEEQLKILLVPKDPNDDKNIVVEIRGAVGGDEANIFAGDLFRMYVKYAEKKGWKLQLIDESPSGVGGYSLVSFMISVILFNIPFMASLFSGAILAINDLGSLKYSEPNKDLILLISSLLVFRVFVISLNKASASGSLPTIIVVLDSLIAPILLAQTPFIALMEPPIITPLPSNAITLLLVEISELTIC